jgi:uncharacterized protein YukE
MSKSAFLAVLVGALAIALSGCRTHQSRIDALQEEHDRLSKQYQKDCGDEYLKAQPQFSQKCTDEAKQMDEVWKQLQAERSK